MKVLWITNIMFPEAKALLGGDDNLRSSGGWMLGSADQLVCRENVNLYVATVSPLVTALKVLKGEKIVFYVIPQENGNSESYHKYWKKIHKDISPDIVHIYGTESLHAYAFMKSCGTNNVVVSIQGLLSTIHKYYNYGITCLDVLSNITIRDLLKGSIFKSKRRFRRSSNYELEMLQMTSHVIGRTSWDRAKVWAINPHAQYHFCNETLRSEFYDGSIWTYDKCLPHSIFISQASYPIKGFHQLLKALPLILRHYPDTIVKVAGNNPTAATSIYQRVKQTGYGRLLRSIIRKYDLDKHILFLGPLNAQQMKNEYLSSNVFVSPSSIENSPNSLAEAQILGVPSISSYVGGAMDMMEGNEENLYRFEEIEMLAFKICRIFDNKDKQINLSEMAQIRHDPMQNDEKLYNIYKKIIDREL